MFEKRTEVAVLVLFLVLVDIVIEIDGLRFFGTISGKFLAIAAIKDAFQRYIEQGLLVIVATANNKGAGLVDVKIVTCSGRRRTIANGVHKTFVKNADAKAVDDWVDIATVCSCKVVRADFFLLTLDAFKIESIETLNIVMLVLLFRRHE